MTQQRSLLPFWIVAGVGVAVIVLGVVLSSRFGTDPSLTASPLIGQPAPQLVLPYLEIDGELDFDALAGDVVVVNFWASWCLACRSEHAALLQTAAQYADLDVTFVGVMVQDQPDNGIRFLDELGRGDPYLYVVDERSRASLEFGVLGVPETFFIDRGGTIVAKVSGPVNAALLTGTLDAIILGEVDELGVVRTGDVQNR